MTSSGGLELERQKSRMCAKLFVEVENSDFTESQLFMGTTTTRIQHNGQGTIPSRVREQAGLSKGDLVEFSFHRGKIVITPKVVIDRSKFPNADDEYTPSQRRVVDRGIAQSRKEYKQGRFFGPFDSHEAFIASLHKEARKLGSNKNNKRPRP